MASKKPGKNKLSGGQKFGLFMMVAAVAVSAFFWITLYIMEFTNNPCSECNIGWGAVIFTWLGIPTFMFGAFILGIASLLKSNKT